VIDGALVVRDSLVLWVQIASRPSEVERRAVIIIFAPDAFQGFAFPERFRKRWSIVWSMRFCADEANGACAIDLPYAMNGSIASHPAADN